MIYLTRTDYDARGNATTAIAACESDETVERAEAHGYMRCSHAKYMALWYWHDMHSYARLGATETAPLARAVGLEKHWIR